MENDSFATASNLTPAEKVRYVEGQVIAMAAGERTDLECPWCGCKTEQGQMLCCSSMGDVVNAVVERLEFQDVKDRVDRVLDQAAKN